MTRDSLKARRAVRAAKAGLTSERVVQTALQLIDAEGLEEFSMRSLARVLGVTPMALYGHIQDRDALLSLVAASILGDVQVPDGSTQWQQWLRESWICYRATVRLHPHIAHLVTTSLVRHSAEHYALIEAFLTTLRKAGLADYLLLDTYNAMVGAVAGFVDLELVVSTGVRIEAAADRRRDELDALDPERFPTLASHRTALDRTFGAREVGAAHEPLDAAFERLLDMLVEGIERMARV